MCAYIPLSAGAVSATRQNPNPPDRPPDFGEQCCHECGKSQKMHVRNDVRPVQKSDRASVPCPFVRQADDVRELKRVGIKLSWIAWMLLVSCFVAPFLGSTDAKVCQSVDVRNTPDGLKNLIDCDVVEGYVQILLIENANASAYAAYSFPKLREITDYLLLYRAFNLETLVGLFPNLRVIQGQNLFSSFALVIWEMHEMKEELIRSETGYANFASFKIGLANLSDIRRGSVRIEKNDNLCFANTIDWDHIAPGGVGGHVIKGNKDPNACGGCPSRCYTDKKPRCWTPQHCQIEPCKACPDSRSCLNNTDSTSGCCHPECVGGCFGPYNDQCFVCKNVRDGDVCFKNCPDGKYEFRSRRCISMTECISEFLEPPSCGKEARRYIPFQGKCLAECPAGFQEVNEKDASGNITHKTCKKCTGDCPKECNAVFVNSLATIQQLKGCTKINGALEINLNGANNIVRELEENLKNIEVVRDYVKIVRSYPLVDLTFLRNLREISGKSLDQGNALIVRDNENLQELFGNATQLRIFEGKFSFSFNPWLCYSKILELSQRLNMTEPLESDVSKWTNGQKASCHNEKLDVKVDWVSELGVVFHVQNFLLHKRLADRRHLIGYEYHYREAVETNVTIFGGRDACGNDGWITGEMKAEANDTEYETHLISQLKPFTQYAFYFNTYMVVTRPDLVGKDTLSGATSDVIYVRTLSGQPSPPLALTVTANSSTEMYISWNSPSVPNANITFYYVQVQIIYDDGDQLKERDYCEKGLEAISVPDKKPTAEEKTRPPSGGDCCSSCPVQGKQTNLRDEEDSQKDSIDFENNLHNTVYVKRESSSCPFNIDEEFPGHRRRRDVSSRYSREISEVLNNPESTPASKFTPPFNTTTITTELGELVSFESRVSEMSAVIRKLRHFSNYRVTVRACRDDEEHRGANSSEQCSIAQYETVLTKPVDDADSIDSRTVVARHESNGTANDIVVEWERPANPNGLIVSYDLELTHEATDSRPYSRCISVNRVRGSNDTRESFREKNRLPGKWKVRLWATSLSGAGPKTVYKEVEVPEQPSHFLGLTIGSVVVVMLFVAGFVFWCRRKGDDIPKAVISSVNPDYPFLENSAYIPDEYEVCRENVQLIRELGQGSFGMVYEGILRGSIRNNASNEEMRCAVKTVNEGATVRERIEFLNEASVMKSFHCNHVVKLLGVVSKGQPTFVIMELMVNGDLKSFLRSLRPDTENSNSGASQRQPPTLKCILRMAAEIADGMAYLAAKKFVHRDLAARNCMVSEELTVKIGDFGMTRDIYETDYYRKGGKGLLPVRWMSPESLKDGLFSSHSDVWSFGVVLWEMATLASQPYQGLANEQVLKYVMEGGKMDMPEGCPEVLYDLMLQCWRFHAKQRPRFVDIVELLMPEVNDDHFPEVSFYHSSEGQEFRQTERQDHSVIEEVQEESDYGEDIPLKTFGSSFRIAERMEKDRSYVPDQTAVEILDIDCPEDDDVLMSESHDEEEPLSPDRDSRDHAPLTYPGQNRRPFIEHRNGNSQLPSSESSKTASDSSKSGSHLSNGSVTNGYVNRRDNAPAQC